MKKILLAAIFLLSGWLVNSQTIVFADPVFKNKLKQWLSVRDIDGNPFMLDINGDGEIQLSEALLVHEIYMDGNSGGNVFSNAAGLEYFTNVKKLTIKNFNLTSLDVAVLGQLEFLDCSGNDLSVLNVSGLANLKSLNASFNDLPYFAVNELTALETLNCSGNSLQHFNISGLANLVTLSADKLAFGAPEPKTLTLSNLPALQSVICSASGLSELNMTGLDNLLTLDCRFNKFTVLDASMLYSIEFIQAANNYLLEYLFIKNGRAETVYFGNNQNINIMKYVCADEQQLSSIQSVSSLYGYTNCHISSYCSFTPGGVSYNTISGANTFDIDMDGCDAGDSPYPRFKLNLTQGSSSNTYIADSSGNFAFYPQNGSYTLTPVIEHPNYFTVSPASVTIDFPQQTSPFIQNFCVVPNGIHHDLEVQTLFMTDARPGYDATYKIVYRNKGNMVQSGTINFAFDDTLIDFVSAFPAVSSQATNNLQWNFLNLQPSETRVIYLVVNLNSPMETPPIIGDDILQYVTSVQSAAMDQTPLDNTFTLYHTVVNSFDPNDKTCLQGLTITPQMVGKEVHYLIRFENTGTANAQNIVVTDMIDTTKFDINSLIPFDGSHTFMTRISNTNKVEFIFENINLPFDDASNDGYVAFKIKTKPTLSLGNTFSNTASIYFDYNFPIITNEYTTTIANTPLAVQDFQFEDYFELAPNPAKQYLDISFGKDMEVSSMRIYNTMGQLIMVIPNARDTKRLEISALQTGQYFLIISTAKGSTAGRFIKE